LRFGFCHSSHVTSHPTVQARMVNRSYHIRQVSGDKTVTGRRRQGAGGFSTSRALGVPGLLNCRDAPTALHRSAWPSNPLKPVL
jgi:hypothetical protein